MVTLIMPLRYEVNTFFRNDGGRVLINYYAGFFEEGKGLFSYKLEYELIGEEHPLTAFLNLRRITSNIEGQEPIHTEKEILALYKLNN